MKLLMAKLAMNDFSSLSGQMAQTRIDVCIFYVVVMHELFHDLKVLFVAVVAGFVLQELKQYVESCVVCGALTLPNEYEHDFTFVVSKENEMQVIETEAVVSVTNEMIVNECVKRLAEKKVSESKKDFRDCVLEMIQTSKHEMNLSLLNNIEDAGLVIRDWLIFNDLFKNMKNVYQV